MCLPVRQGGNLNFKLLGWLSVCLSFPQLITLNVLLNRIKLLFSSGNTTCKLQGWSTIFKLECIFREILLEVIKFRKKKMENSSQDILKTSGNSKSPNFHYYYLTSTCFNAG